MRIVLQEPVGLPSLLSSSVPAHLIFTHALTCSWGRCVRPGPLHIEPITHAFLDRPLLQPGSACAVIFCGARTLLLPSVVVTGYW